MTEAHLFFLFPDPPGRLYETIKAVLKWDFLDVLLI